MAAKKKKEHLKNSIAIYSYSVRKAIAPRKRFAIQRTHTENNKKIHEDYKDPTLHSINEEYLANRNELTYNIALQKLEKHIKHLTDSQKIDHTVDNSTKRAINKFLRLKATQVEAGRIRYTTLEKLKHEIVLLEQILNGKDLLSMSESTLHSLLTKTRLAQSTKNKLIILSNSIRSEAGISAKISSLGKSKIILSGNVDFINLKDQEAVLKTMTPIDYHITKLGIATGLREGELFGLTQKSRKGLYLHITQQLYRDEKTGNPKNNRQRLVPLSNVAIESFDYLMAHMKAFKAQRKTYSSRLRRITKKTLNHAYSIYDLRHTFAIECLSKGLAPITVCSWMGNSLVVFQQHYVGYMNNATNDELIKLNA